MYKRCKYDQIYSYFNQLSQGYITLYCLFVMIEKRKASLDNGNQNGALMTDLYKKKHFTAPFFMDGVQLPQG